MSTSSPERGPNGSSVSTESGASGRAAEPPGAVGVVILAAGKGTRMRSRLPKVAHSLVGRSMLEHVVRIAAEAIVPESATPASVAVPALSGAAQSRFVVVVGHEAKAVRDALHWTPAADLAFVEQEPQRGTGDAVLHAREALTAGPDAPTTILVLYGDTPLVRPQTVRALLDEHARSGASLTFLTGHAEGDTDYGRVVRDGTGRVAGVIERRHATPEQARISEVNSGIYCFAADWLWERLGRLEPHENGEYYLTDLIARAVAEGRIVATASATLAEAAGVNDRVQLAEAAAILRRRLVEDLMRGGVTVEDPATTYVEAGVVVGMDTTISANTHLRGATVIGERCAIGPNAVITGSRVGDDCVVLASYLDDAVMERNTHIGPMGRLRPGALLEEGVYMGNFGEVKNATLGRNVRMHHMGFIGDADIGADTNIAAGVITMNYDGREKHRTTVGERVFLGCDTLLRAPVTLGDDAATGGGSVVTKNVPAGALVVGMPARQIRRVRQPGPEASPRPPSGSHPGGDGPSEGHSPSAQAPNAADSEAGTDVSARTSGAMNPGADGAEKE